MDIAITKFNPQEHLGAAAALLVGRQRRDRSREPLLPATFEDPQTCRAHIESALTAPDPYGVIAQLGGEAVGFAIMTPFLPAPTHMTASFFPPRSVNVAYGAHAAREGMEYDVYREMYAALADHFVRRGYFDHLVYVAPTDAATCDAWASLGFGRTLTAAIRGVEPVEPPAAGVELHQAGPEDMPVVAALNEYLALHHSRSPIFWPFLRETEASAHEFQRDLLKDPAVNVHWIAYEDGKPVGMNTFMAPFWISPLIAPEKTVYLYQGIVAPEARRGGVGSAILAKGIEWAREQGYDHVALHFASANVSGARFWQSNGFKPVEYRLTRRVDERMAWANR